MWRRDGGHRMRRRRSKMRKRMSKMRRKRSAHRIARDAVPHPPVAPQPGLRPEALPVAAARHAAHLENKYFGQGNTNPISRKNTKLVLKRNFPNGEQIGLRETEVIPVPHGRAGASGAPRDPFFGGKFRHIRPRHT